MMRSAWRQFLFAAATAGSLLIGLAFIIHFTVRDRIPGVAIFFYATPWPVIAFGAAVLAPYWRRRRPRIVTFSLAVVAVIAFASWLCLDWQWRGLADARGELRVVQWNVDRPDWRQAGDMRWLAAQDAGLITIAEREPRRKVTLERWRAAFPAYQLVPSEGEMLCLVRGEVVSVEEQLLAEGSFSTLIRTRIRGREVTVLQVDVDGRPAVDRGEALRKLVAVANEHLSENLLVVGDFNTPKDSAFLVPLRALTTNAFEAAGRGCAATWPLPLPTLSLDQMWTSGRLRPVRCEHIISWRSDHRAVVAEFDFTPLTR